MATLWLKNEAFCNFTLHLRVRCYRRPESSRWFSLQGQAVQEEYCLASFHVRPTQRPQRRCVILQKIWILTAYLHVRYFHTILAFIFQMSSYRQVYQWKVVDVNIVYLRSAALLGIYAAQNGNYVPTFRDNLPSSWTIWRLNMGTICCLSVRNCHCRLRTIQKRRKISLYGGESLKSDKIFFPIIFRKF